MSFGHFPSHYFSNFVRRISFPKLSNFHHVVLGKCRGGDPCFFLYFLCWKIKPKKKAKPGTEKQKALCLEKKKLWTLSLQTLAECEWRAAVTELTCEGFASQGLKVRKTHPISCGSKTLQPRYSEENTYGVAARHGELERVSSRFIYS